MNLRIIFLIIFIGIAVSVIALVIKLMTEILIKRRFYKLPENERQRIKRRTERTKSGGDTTTSKQSEQSRILPLSEFTPSNTIFRETGKDSNKPREGIFSKLGLDFNKK